MLRIVLNYRRGGVVYRQSGKLMAVEKLHTVGIIGIGNMGSAIAKGLCAPDSSFDIAYYDVDQVKAKTLHEAIGGCLCANVQEIAAQSEIVILALKPDVIISFVREHRASFPGKPVVSIAAGIALAAIEEALGGGAAVRVMPNTPALVGKGMSVISPGLRCGAGTIELVEKIFSFLGRTMVLPEKLMDAVTAVSGCGPAYAFTMIQAMADAGVKLGIPRDKAIILAAQTLAGAAEMALSSHSGPIELRGMVTSPGGSTIEAVHCLERAGFAGILIDAIEAAAKKSEKLGGKKS